ncbi:RNA-directed DNA polymerase from mobile element jockey [Merluccius polli]|uniref:RNA-directed DNA polymerase from mobile element jockey n=1 Tax=Merluccius polli TaxID=89951 RepID=A0AA47MAJ9_MERPO|nr:RNA-directed DNA polymerase from mobile element jockey [Merluccius polli]
MGDDFPGQRLITEFLHEVFLLLWVGKASHLCHHANTLSRDLIGCRRACGYPDAGGGKQVTPDEVCQQHVHGGRRCDEDNLEPVVSAESCFFGFNKEVMKKFNQAELFPFQGKGIDPSVLHLKTLSGSNIEQVPVYKYLGIWIDEKLNFSSHIDFAKQLRQKIGFFYRHKSSLPLSCRKRIIESVFMPVLDYGDIIYRNASMSSLKILDVIYHSAIRFATSASYNTHHCTLYATIGWPSLTERRFKHWIQFIYKAIIGKLPSYISLLLNCQSSAYPAPAVISY